MKRSLCRIAALALATLVSLVSVVRPLLAVDGGFAGGGDPRSGDRFLVSRTGAQGRGDLLARAARIGREEVRAERTRAALLRKTGRGALVNAAQWVSLGPDNVFLYGGDGKGGKVSGMVADLSVHPTDPKTIWAGTAGGGVWKSTDGGQSWRPTMDDLGRIQIGAVAVAPSNPNRVYAGSGCGDSSTWIQNYEGLGLLVSDDGGESWRMTATGATVVGGAFYELEVDPANPDVVVAATTNGLFVSENGGDTWTPTLPDPVSACSLSRCPSAPQRLFAATLTGANVPGLWTSADGGRSWSPLPTTGLKSTASKRGRAEIAVAPQDPLRVYLLLASRSTGKTLEFASSTDGGQSWKPSTVDQTGNGILGTEGNTFSVLAVDPASPDTLWAGGFDLWRSTDAGVTFQRLSDWAYPPDPSSPPTLPFVHADKHAFRFGPDGVPYFATDGGIFTTPDGGASFVPLNGGRVTMQLYTVCASALDPAVTMGGAQDNGSQMRTSSGSWTQLASGDGGGCLTHPTNPLVLLGSVQDNVISRSTDGGTTFALATNGLADVSNASSNFWTPLRRSPAKPDTIYTLSYYRVWISNDNGGSWTKNGNGPVTSANVPIRLTDFTVLPTDGSRIAVLAEDSTLLETPDEGATWTTVGTLPDGGVGTGTIRYDRRSPNVIWACSGAGDANLERVWRTTSTGGWETLSRTGQAGGLPDVPVFTVEQDPDDAATWYAGTYVGLYRTGDDGLTWQRHGTGLPNVIVTAVDFYRPDHKVRIATLGRGIWEAPTSALGAQRAPAAAILFPSEGTQVPVGGTIQYVGTGLSALAGGKVTYRWSWGDQSPDSFGASVPHLFRRYGAYAVRLTVTDATGASTTVARAIVVRRQPPSGGEAVSLQGGAVQVEVDFRDPYVNVVDEAAPTKQAETFAWFSFGDPANPEVFVKVLDFGPSRPYLLFWAGLTDFEFAVTFTTTATGKTASFVVPARSYRGGYDGTELPRGGGAALLSRDGGGVTQLEGGMERERELALLGEMRGLREQCEKCEKCAGEPGAAELLLAGGQVSVALSWRDPRSGEMGSGVALPQGDAFGYFFFRDAANPEVFVKVLDFGAERPFLLFWAGLTDFEYVVTYRNVKSGKTFSVTKRAGSFDGGADTTSLRR